MTDRDCGIERQICGISRLLLQPDNRRLTAAAVVPWSEPALQATRSRGLALFFVVPV
jgi:hypothetical protein